MMVLSRSKNAATRPRCSCGCGCEDACSCWDWSAVLWGSCIGTCRKKSVVGAVLVGAALTTTDVVDVAVVARVVDCCCLLSPVTRAILVGLSLWCVELLHSWRLQQKKLRKLAEISGLSTGRSMT